MQRLSIPGFELLDKVGHGGMATVWKARQLSLDRIVAIKVLSPRLASDPADVDRFRIECKSTAMLKHPGIVQVYDAIVHEGMCCLVMEYVAGYSLGDWIRRKAPLGEVDALLVTEHVARALLHAWKAASLIHCDIKPDNIMIDTDGTIKVADLGLAVTIGGMSTMAEADEIMGTPNYMSPEQITGTKPLDCRTDIYALGATLYQMVTGKMLFGDVAEDAVMDTHLRGQVADALDVNSKLSSRLCWMIEKMLAKNREHRHPNWEAVLSDLARLRAGEYPARPHPPHGASTMKRSRKRSKPSVASSPQVRSRALAVVRSILVALISAATVAGVVVLARKAGQHAAKAQAAIALPPSPSAPQPAPADRSPSDGAEGMLEFARSWWTAHPDQYAEAIAKFQKVAEDTRGSRVALMADDDIRQVRQARDRAVTNLVARLKVQAAGLAGEKRFAEAAALLENYSGALQKESQQGRKDAAAEVRREAAAAAEAERRDEERAAAAFDALSASVASDLVKGDLRKAMDSLSAGTTNPALVRREAALEPMRTLVQNAVAMDQRVLNSFAEQKGQEVTVQLNAGQRTCMIREVSGGTVSAEQRLSVDGGMAMAAIRFGVEDLAPRERQQRMGPDDDPAVALANGAMACARSDLAAARTAFERVPPPLGPLLAERLTALSTQADNDASAAAFADLMRQAGASAVRNPPDLEAARTAAEGLQVSPDKAQALTEAVRKYRDRFGKTDFGQQAEGVLALVEAKAATGPARIPEPVLPPPTGEVVRAVAFVAAMRDGNLGLEPWQVTCESDPESGRVTGIRAMTPKIENLQSLARLGPSLAVVELLQCGATDFSPLGALPALRRLDLSGSSHLSDISFLRQATLRELVLNDTRVRDLTPIKDMPLQRLELRNTRAFAFDLLRRMPLQAFDASGTQFNDLAVLKDMPLRFLSLAGTKVYDFQYLRRMPLEDVNLRDTQLKDLSALSGLRLRRLDLANTKITSIETLAPMPLEMLNLNGTAVRDFSPLSKLDLTEAYLDSTKLKDLAPLTGMKLTSFSCTWTGVDDILPLRGMPLAYVNLAGTGVSDLSPLAGAPLTALDISNTKVTSIRPLAGSKLKELRCRGTPVQDFTPIHGMPIEVLEVELPPERIMALVRHLPQLRELNGQFWMRGGPRF